MPAIRLVRARQLVLGVVLSATAGLTACSLNDLVNGSALPADQRDPNAIKTPAGAIAAYNATLVGLSNAVGGRYFSDSSGLSSGGVPSFIFISGLLTDELQFYRDLSGSVFPTGSEGTLDSRTSPENDFSQPAKQRFTLAKQSFESLQTVRSRTREAVGALRKYAPDTPPALIGHMFAIEGIADVLLAELFCSGVPLSALQFEGSFTLTRGFTSEEVYRQAIELFDSAIVYAADSARILNFAKVGKARALLGIGEYAAAAQAVAGVPTESSYVLTYTSFRQNTFGAPANSGMVFNATVGNAEGQNGLPFRFGNDPRSAAVPRTEGVDTIYMPKRYFPVGSPPNSNPGTASIPIANGIEARLIEAEAALQAHEYPRMLTILNKLRTTCTTIVGCASPAPAGDGGYANLPPLQDPGSDTARATLLFTERAHWLFLTGHRQGDLRRMVRQYNRREDSVYPIGPWGPQALVPYGTDVNIPVPVEEQENNGLYHGCLNRDA